MASIMDMFRPKPAANPTPVAAATQQTLGPAVAGAEGGNPTVPNAENNTNKAGVTVPAALASANTDPNASPLSSFADLFKVDTNAKVRGSPVPVLTADPKALAEAVKSVNFMSGIPQELLDKAGKGDSTALMQVINLSGQAGLAQSAAITSRIVENALNDLNKKYETEVIPEVLRRNNVDQAVNADNSLFTNPAAAPILEGLKSQLLTKYPTASPEDISKMAGEYLKGFTTEYAAGNKMKLVSTEPETGTSGQRQSRVKETDWEKLLAG